MHAFFGRQSVNPSENPVTPQEMYTVIMRDQVGPLLENEGFTATGRTFYRQRGEIVDVINFQGSQSNRAGKYSFYINCCLDSEPFQRVTTGHATARPNYLDCPFRTRIDEIIGRPQDYTITPGTDTKTFADNLLQSLRAVLDFYKDIRTEDDLLDRLVAGNYLQAYEPICQYLAATGDTVRLTRYIRRLHDRFAPSDGRWPLFAGKIAAQIGDYASRPEIAPLLAAAERSS